MQPKSTKKRERDVQPILFQSSSVSSTQPSSAKTSFSEVAKAKTVPGDSVFVCIKLVEVNVLKVKNKQEIEGKNLKASELSSKKRDYAFPVSKEEIEQSKYLKTNFIPAENVVELPVSVNMNLPYPRFEALQKVIEAMVEKEKKGSQTYPLEVSNSNSVEMFIAACLLGLEELAVSIYQTFVRAKLSLKLLVGMLLITLESNLSQLYTELYQIFREYWLYKEGYAPDPSPMVEKIFEGKDDGTTIEYKKEKDMFFVYHKEKVEFGFPPGVLKRPFEMLRKEIYRQYYKPEQKYHVLNVRRIRTIDNDDGTIETGYPHRYVLVNQQNDDEVVMTAIRETEYGDFYLFGTADDDEIIYGNNYIGHVTANTWGTTFDLYDDGIEEGIFQDLPKFICAMRAKLATISFQTNFMGDTPRELKFTYLDFAEKKNAELVLMKPKYDEENDCYTLNFFGKAKLASARNFILTFPHSQENIIFLHGKASKDFFNLDFRHPLNFVQAFSLSLVSIGKKFCVS